MSMSPTASLLPRSTVGTSAGEIAYLDSGTGPPALFVHGVFFNGELWSGQLEAVSDLRRCLAPDLLAHGRSACPSTPLTIVDQAEALISFLDALQIDDVDLVGNDTGGAVAQLLVSMAPRRVRSLVLTNCDVEGSCPPEAFQPIVDTAREGQLAAGVVALAGDVEAIRAAVAMGFERPDQLSDDYLLAMFSPFLEQARAEALEAYVAGLDDAPLVAVHDDLAAFESPTLIVWGTGDEFFGIESGRWLAATIAGADGVVELDGAKIFFPIERDTEFSQELRRFWTALG